MVLSTESARPTARLAIANQDRRLLPGPALLDDLVHCESEHAIAIHYIGPKDDRILLTFNQCDLIVPVVLPQHPSLYISYLAVLKLGAAFCPVTPDTPHERIAFIIEDVAAKLLVCLPEMQQTLQALLPKITCVAVNLQDLLSGDEQSLQLAPRPSAKTAYVMYTSGSTGKPKGVPVSHHAVCQSLLAHDENLPQFERFLQFAAPTFDVSIFEIFFPWYRGSAIVCCERETMLADLPGIINSMDVDAVELTPTVATTLLRTRSAVPRLKILLTIGEMLTKHVVVEFGFSHTQDGMLYAMYGPTEASIHCTMVAQMSATDSVHNIGRPLATVSAYILNDSTSHRDHMILDIDQPGELAIAGQLAEGYLNRPDQTAAAFVELPGHGCVYRTGDRAVMKTNGEIHIYGRIVGGQVKLRGQRVELGEVEQAAMQVAGVHLAAALVLNEILVLFCSGEPSLTLKNVEARCKAWLQRHMRPGHIVIVPAGLPQLPSGKVDRKGLENIYENEMCENAVRDSRSDHSDLDAYLQKVLCEELKSELSWHTSLRNCGLDSLQAIRVASKLRSKFPAITISTVLDAESITDLSRLITRTGAHSISQSHTNHDSILKRTSSKLYDLEHYSSLGLNIEKVLPCTPIQIAMLAETSQDSRYNLNEIVLATQDVVTFSDIVSAFETLACNNEILRTAFAATGDANMPFVQLVRASPSLSEPASMTNTLQLRKSRVPHSIIVSLHHAIYDGWSWDLIMKDLNHLLRGTPVGARPTFEDYLRGQQALDDSRIQQDLVAWARDLSEVEACQLPTLRPEVYEVSTRSIHSTELCLHQDSLAQFARRRHTSGPAIMHSAVLLLLCMLLDTTDVTTGLVISGRDPVINNIEDVIGPLISTLPVSVRTDRCRNTEDLMQQVHRKHLHCLQHSRPSLAQINSALKRSTNTPLFDTIFVWQESLYSQSVMSDFVSVSSSFDFLPYAWIIEVEPKQDKLCLKSTYDPARIADKQIRIIHQQIDGIVTMLTKSPAETLVPRKWSLLDENLLSTSNVDFARFQSDNFTAKIESIALHDPDKIAVDFIVDFDPTSASISRERLTYRQLNKQSLHAANVLRTKYKLKKDNIVAIQSKKCISLYVLICATLRAGVAYLCIEPNTPETRVKEILQQAQPQVLVVDAEILPKYRDQSSPMVASFDSVVSENATLLEPLRMESSGRDLAYAVFTSGSTGAPKGVLVTRANLMSNIQHLSETYPHDATSKLLQSCSPAFDVSVFEIFWTWHCGLTLCSANNDVLFRDVEVFINTAGITHLSMTPSVAALVNPDRVPNVAFLVCSGEPMSAKVFNAWSQRGLYQGYGPSETTNICNVRHYRQDRAYINNVGPAFPNTSLFVCARRRPEDLSRAQTLSDFTLLPKGSVGEIWIGGQQVGRGYTDPDLTSRSWLDHPKYGRLYRSGDIGKLLADDSLVVLGREDDQAKIRGQRVELNEINARLMQFPHVSDAFSFILPKEYGNDKLVCFFVVASGDSEKLIGMLFEHLRDTLPIYMIPEALIPLDELPLTHQAKVDRKRLTTIHSQMSHEQMALYSDSSPAELGNQIVDEKTRKVVEVLSELTGLPTSEINVHGSFFAYGLDSISAIAFAQRLRSSNIGTIEVSTVMRHSSIMRLLPFIEDVSEHARYGTPASELVPDTTKSSLTKKLEAEGYQVHAVLPCTSLQEAMLSTSSSRGATSYLNHVVLRLFKDFNKVKNAWSCLVQRHEILRTIFVMTEDDHHPYMQIVLGCANLPWTEATDVSMDKVPPLFDSLPYRLQLVPSSSGHTELHLFMHHAIYDAQSLTQLLIEVELICKLQPLSDAVPFSKYLDHISANDNESLEAFWNRQLKDVTPSRLSEVVEQHDSNSSQSSSKSCPVPYTELVTLARKTSTTLLALCQASLSRVLSALFANRQDICFGTVLSGRTTTLTTNAVGPCFNTVPTRVAIRRNTTNADICHALQEYNAEVLPFQGTPLRRLQRQYSRDGRRLFDVLLLLQSPRTDLDQSIWKLVRETGQMDFPFVVEVQPEPGTNVLHVTIHNTVVKDNSFNDFFLGQFLAILKDTAEKPPALAGEVMHLLPESELRFINYVRTFHSNIDGHRIEQEHNDTNKALLDSTCGKHLLEALASMTSRNIQSITPRTNVFQLGLDSISTVQLAARLRVFGYRISSADILDKPTLSDIVRFCQQSQGVRDAEHVDGFDIDAFEKKHEQSIIGRFHLDRHVVQAIWPCSATQIGILSEYQKSHGRLYYNSIQVRLGQDFDQGRLERAWEQIVRRHEMLRTTFVEIYDKDIPFAMLVYVPEHDKPMQILLEQEDQYPLRKPTANIIPKPFSRPPWSFHLSKDGGEISINVHMFHALYDARALDIVLHDMQTLYYGEDLKRPPSVHEVLSLIVHNNRSQDMDTSYWKQMQPMAHATTFPDLNIERDVPSKLQVSWFQLTSPLSMIQKACEDAGCALLVACQAAWAQLLAAYTAQQYVTFGTILSGRSFNKQELNDAVFPTINTVPVIVDMSHDSESLLEQIARTNARLHKNPHLSLPRIKAALDVEGNLFDSILVLQKYSQADQAQRSWEISSDQASAEYAVSIEVVPRDDELALQLTYNQKVLPKEHASVLLLQYEQLLHDVLHIPTHHDTESKSIKAGRSPVTTSIKSDHKSLPDLVLARATQDPTATALEFVSDIRGEQILRQTWTYAELVARSSQIANLILEHGAQRGDLIAICFNKCPEASFTLLGTLMAGCAYVAIDPGAPKSRQDFILQDASCKLVITTSDIVVSFEGMHDLQVLCVDDDEMMGTQSTERPQLQRPVAGTDVCYCLYTSGTTGTPKGCIINHNSVVQALVSFAHILEKRWTENSRWLQFAAYHFDVSVLEHFWSWSKGICAVVTPRDLLFEDLSGTISKLCITHLALTPSLARLLTPEVVPSLREGVFIVGGEQLRQDVIETWGEEGCLHNFYGPSEVTIGCTFRPISHKTFKLANIGQSFINVGTYVVAPGTDNLVLVGAVGELCLSGPLVGVGYLNRPDLTAERFTILRGIGDRVYRTGDLVRMLHDNSFEFIGRIDDQIKLRGQRLEIGEINHVISQAIQADVATLVLKHSEQEKEQLVAFFAQETTAKYGDRRPKALEDPEMRARIRVARNATAEQLPAYMVPTYFMAIDFVPLTVNNKVDSKALKALYHSLPLNQVRQFQITDVQDQSVPVEKFERIVALVTEFLDLARDDITWGNSLLQLGLDSISAIGLSRKLKKVGYSRASVATILKHSMIGNLAEILCQNTSQDGAGIHEEQQLAEQRIRAFAAEHEPSISRKLASHLGKVKLVAPCTPLQEGMISKMLSSNADQPPYLVKFLFSLNDCDIPALKRAWDVLESQLDVLRTRFVPTEEGYAQVIFENTPNCCHVDYGTDSMQEDPLQSIDASFRRWIETARGLDSACPWQVWLVQRDQGRSNYMSIFLFHGLYDGISMPLMLDQLNRVYQQSSESLQQPSLYEALSFGPLLSLKQAPDFWRKTLPHVKLLPLQDAERLDTPMSHTVRKELSLKIIHQQGRAMAVTSQAIFQAAWLFTLAKFFDVNPTIGTVLSGRSIDLEGADKFIFPMFNTLPFSITVTGERPSLADLIATCHQKNVDVLPFQHTPLGNIRKWLAMNTAQELFNSLFVYQGLTDRARDTSKWPWSEEHSDVVADYPLNIEIEENLEDQYSISIVSSRPSLRKQPISKLLELFTVTLEAISTAREISLPKAFSEDKHIIKPYQLPHTQDKEITEYGHENESTATSIIKSEISRLASIDESAIGSKQPTIFEIGLDSIDALKLTTRLKRRGLALPVSKILRHPTIAGMAEQSIVIHDQAPINGVHDDAKWYSLLKDQGVHLEGIETTLPTTSMQEGLLLDYERYFNVMVWKLSAQTDLRPFVEAVHRSYQNLPILRTKFVMLAEPVEKVSFLQLITKAQSGGRKSQLTFSLRNHEALKEHIHSLRKNAGLINSQPQLQVATLDDGRIYFILALSHAHYDAWSLHLLLNHIQQSYQAQYPGPMEVGTIAMHVNAIKENSVSEAATRFWSAHLHNVQACLVQNTVGDCSATLRHKTSSIKPLQLHAVCRKHGITLQSLGLAVWALTLSHLSKQRDVSFGLVVSGRMSEETENLVFPVFNTVIYRPQIDLRCTASDLLKSIHNMSVQIYEYQQFPLTNALTLARTGGAELFNTLFTFQKKPRREADDQPIFEEVDLDDGELSPPYAINVEMEEKNEGLVWTVATQAGVMASSGVEELLDKLDKVLDFLIHNDSEPVFDHYRNEISICGLPRTEFVKQEEHMQPIGDRQSEQQEVQNSQWTPMEETVRNVFSQVSNVPQEEISKHTTLFELGLDSISAIKIAKSLREVGLRVPVSIVLKGQSAAKIAAAASAELPNQVIKDREQVSRSLQLEENLLATINHSLDLADVSPQHVETVLPATAGHVYMLDMWRASKGRLFYATFWLDVRNCSEIMFRAAFQMLIGKTPALRTRFIESGNKYYQVVFKTSSKETGPLQYEIMQNGRGLLVSLHIHHAIYDAVSLEVMLQALEKLCRNKDSSIELATNIEPFLTTTMSKAAQAQAREFWMNYLDGNHASERKTRKSSFTVDRSSRFFPDLLSTTMLAEVGRKTGLSIQSIFFAAIARVRARRRHQAEGQASPTITLGVYFANRSLDIERITELVQPTFNILPVRVDVSKGSPLLVSAHKLQGDMMEISLAEHCGVNMRDLHAWTGVEVDCYVNFIKLPENTNHEGETHEAGKDEDVVRIQHASGEAREQAKSIAVTPGASPLIGGTVEVGEGVEWCRPALDVEAKIDADGMLAVGMFAPEDMFGDKALEDLMVELREDLEAVRV
ncbi:hypothetical protein LTR05_002101 [Lithohypha guttulata]|uniref:Nonribosomal peptide synthetase sidC n=1 Tax=Lithohypha guttulata TaxID=1690604 RepID=A0AAN7YHR0_9EURO|nr:hypothetical protein LTR05_002101 [Lithohypha guttulata]